MSFISDARNKVKRATYSTQNNDIINDYLKLDLLEDDLKGVIGMMKHPEVGQPVIENIDRLMKQPAFNPALQEQFAVKVMEQPKWNDEKSQHALSVLDQTALQKARDTVGVIKLTPVGRLSDKLKVTDQVPSATLAERIHQRVEDTYSKINDRVTRAKNKMTQPFKDTYQKVADKSKAITHKITGFPEKVEMTVVPAFKLLQAHLSGQMDLFKDEYQTRKIAYENDRRFTNALNADKVDGSIIAEGINNMDSPEIRHTMFKNADTLLNHKDMTPELADRFFVQSQAFMSEMREDDPMFQNVSKAFAEYDQRTAATKKTVAPLVAAAVKTEVPTVAKVEEKEPVVIKSAEDKEIDQWLDKTLDENEPVPDVKTASLQDFEDDGKAIWAIPTVQGTTKLSDETIEEMFKNQYPSEYTPADDLPKFDDSYFNSLDDAQVPKESTPDILSGLESLEEPKEISLHK